MLKNMSLTFKLALLPAVAIIGLLLFVGFTYKQLSTNDERLVLLESRSYPTLEKADAAIFQFSLLPGLLNSAVAASEVAELDRARTVLGEIATLQQALFSLTQGDPELNAQVGQWQSAVEKYSGNALNSSERLIKGSATFDDLRPNLDRMSSDLQQAQKLASEFRANAYEEFQQQLDQIRTDNRATINVGIGLTLALVALVSIGATVIIRGIMGNVYGVIRSLKGIARGDGDLTQRVNVDANDEIGAMIELFNGFLDKLQGTIRQISTRPAHWDRCLRSCIA